MLSFRLQHQGCLKGYFVTTLRRYAWAFALLVILITVAARAGAETVTDVRVVMGTTLEVTVVAADTEEALRAFDAVEAEFVRIDREMSGWRKKSPVSLINRYAGKRKGKRRVKVSEELFKVISGAIKVGRMTGGAFDPSRVVMHKLWDFRPGSHRKPTDREIEERLGLIDYRLIETDPEKMTVGLKKKGMAIGLGGIARGYAVDQAMELLSKMGIRNAVIKAGGDIRVQGRRERGVPWRIDIKHPREDGPLAQLPLSNISISTSGDYERFFIKDDVLYHHIIDPRTGYPARGCQSVTILAPDTMTSDAFATAVFVLGPEAGLRLVERLNGVEAIIVDASGATLTSSGIDLK